jgi:hypothetical protein
MANEGNSVDRRGGKGTGRMCDLCQTGVLYESCRNSV